MESSNMAFDRRSAAFVLSIGAMLHGIGCSREVRVDVHPVKGQLFVRGAPASGAMVVFHPEATADSRAIPRGFVDKDGQFQLSTYVTNDGAANGKFKVAIEWRKPNPADPTDDVGISLVPSQYTRPSTTPIEVSITPETTELPRFEVK